LRWIALAGYMGAGKSVIGRRVASRLGLAFVDADRLIEEREGEDIPQIFERRGEVWFRRTEEEVLREVLQSSPPGVLALGGGALGSARTRDLLSRTAWVVWLRVDPDVAWSRVEGTDRPLATGRDRFVARAAKREPLYAEAADVEVSSEEPPDEVAARVTAWAQARMADDADA